MTRQDTRLLSKNLTIQFNKVIYQIQSERPRYALRNAQVTICENAQGVITILYKNKSLPYTIFKQLPHQATAVDTKNLNHAIQLPKPPPSDHPWRSYGKHLNGNPIQELLPNGAD